MAVIRVSVTEEMKRRMDSFPHIDWSEVAEEILGRLEREYVDVGDPRAKGASRDIKGISSRGGDAVESKHRAQRGR